MTSDDHGQIPAYEYSHNMNNDACNAAHSMCVLSYSYSLYAVVVGRPSGPDKMRSAIAAIQDEHECCRQRLGIVASSLRQVDSSPRSAISRVLDSSSRPTTMSPSLPVIRVAIIGAGSSGLATLKQVVDAFARQEVRRRTSLDVVVYESKSDVGGVWWVHVCRGRVCPTRMGKAHLCYC